ncbi:MAG: PBECR2 nuclease fold domain-containing protein [Nanoarchaeota archaeon]
MKILNIIDKNGKEIYLTLERLKHIQKHPHMHDPIENIKETLKNPTTIRYENNINYFYKEFKHLDPSERYLMVSVKYLNGNGFIITSFFTNKLTGEKWKME